jgi:hypothetical protein
MNILLAFRKNKAEAGLLAALLLGCVSLYSFCVGLKIEADGFEWAIGLAIWIALTIIQFIGNDFEDGHVDILLRAGWGFSYVLGIGVGMYALSNIISAGNTLLTYIICFGLAGASEILPERLVVLYMKSKTINPKVYVDKPAHEQKYKANNTLFGNDKPSKKYTPQHRPFRSAVNNMDDAKEYDDGLPGWFPRGKKDR